MLNQVGGERCQKAVCQTHGQIAEPRVAQRKRRVLDPPAVGAGLEALARMVVVADQE